MRWRDEGERKGRGPAPRPLGNEASPSLTKSRERFHAASTALPTPALLRITLGFWIRQTRRQPRLFWVAPFLVQSHAAAHGEYFPNCRSANYAARINSFLMITLAVPFGTRSCPSTRRLNRECTTCPLPSTHAILFRFPPS